MAGVRAELVFPDTEECPIAEASAAVEKTVREVTWAPTGEGTVVEQFKSESELEEFDHVFDYGSQQVYEFERDAANDCICERIEAVIGPITESYARDGNLYVTLHVSDVDGLREIMQNLRDQFGAVGIEYLVQGRDEKDEGELVPVDVRQLTERQREVLETAHGMGYFDYPREANASDVAAELGIESSTFTEHLNAAQSKLLGELLPSTA